MRNVATGMALFLAAGAAAAQGVTITGSNTLRVERYDTRGNTQTTPYPVTGNTGYDELILNFNWQPTSFDRWRGLIAGVANDSPYRSPDNGLVPERLQLSRENGEGAIPYRAEAGDFFGFTSLLTQQRPLKGASVELQPTLATENLRTSILLFGGAFQQNWRHFQWGDDSTIGASWLTEIGTTRITGNVLHNERGANATLGFEDRTQNVASLAIEAPFTLGATRWRAEGEVAALRGDHDGVPLANDGRDKSDTGYYAQLSGSLAGEPLSWRLRAERYGQDYRPFGGAIPPDRRSTEAHLTWLSPGSLTWRARIQDYRDENETANPLDTRVIGGGVSGPLNALQATLSADVFQQDIERNDGSFDQRNFTANAFLSRPFGSWVWQLALLYQRMDNHVASELSGRTKQAMVSATIPLSFGGVQGSITPGVTWRDVTGAFATRDIQANLQMALFGGPHRFILNAGRLSQDPSFASAPEVATVNFGADYRYRWRQHEFGVDLTVFDRRPHAAEKTEAYRAGLQWTYFFDPQPMMPAPARVAAAPAAAAGPVPRDAGLLMAVGPGDDLESTLTRLSASGISGGSRQPDAVVFEVRLLNEIDERQRVALVHSAGRIERVALLVSLAETGSADDAGRIYERVRRSLIERFGRPATTFEEGAFGPQFARDVQTGRLIRIAEWSTDRGTIRLGIPRRLDGVARIEVQHARSFASPRDTAWGLDLR